MQFDIITIFPKFFSSHGESNEGGDSYFDVGILARAQKKGLIKIKIHDLRKYTTDKRKTIDDTPYGGGAGMILKVEPIYRTLLDLKIIKKDGTRTKKASKNTAVLLMSAKGKKYDQAMARKFSRLSRLVLICGRYEGVDERVAKYLIDDEISIGEYVLTGGELPSMIITDSVTRLIGGVLGNKKSAEDESFSQAEYLEHPHYTKPEIFLPDKKTRWRAPEVLLSGNHKEIEKWKEKHSS